MLEQIENFQLNHKLSWTPHCPLDVHTQVQMDPILETSEVNRRICLEILIFLDTMEFQIHQSTFTH